MCCCVAIEIAKVISFHYYATNWNTEKAIIIYTKYYDCFMRYNLNKNMDSGCSYDFKTEWFGS